MTVTEILFRLARASATGRAVRRGHGARRARNVLIGRAVARVTSRLYR